MIDREQILKEVTFYTSRASGPGGQHVNKTESKVELHWRPEESSVLSEDQKFWLRKGLAGRLTDEGLLILTSQDTRSQLKNREIIIERFLALVSTHIHPPKKRIRTKPSRSAVEKRLKQKKQQAEKKQRREKPG